MSNKICNERFKKSLSKKFRKAFFIDEKLGCLFKALFNNTYRFWQNQV